MTDKAPMMKNEFSNEQIEILKAEFSKVETVSVESLTRFHDMFNKMTDAQLLEVSKAGIKFLSKLAVNEGCRRGINTKTIKAGQTLTARSIADYDCVFSVEILERKGSFVTVKVQGNTKRMKVHSDSYGELIYAMGKYSMCPIFRAI
jgi:hypothetical protein